MGQPLREIFDIDFTSSEGQESSSLQQFFVYADPDAGKDHRKP